MTGGCQIFYQGTILGRRCLLQFLLLCVAQNPTSNQRTTLPTNGTTTSLEDEDMCVFTRVCLFWKKQLPRHGAGEFNIRCTSPPGCSLANMFTMETQRRTSVHIQCLLKRALVTAMLTPQSHRKIQVEYGISE
jgi:hypothetical protein